MNSQGQGIYPSSACILPDLTYYKYTKRKFNRVGKYIMTNIDSLAEQHVTEYESRLMHMDELIQRVNNGAGAGQELDSELQALIKERDRLASHVEQMKLRSLEDWDEEELALAGPMGVWDALAQQLEKVVERLER